MKNSKRDTAALNKKMARLHRGNRADSGYVIRQTKQRIRTCAATTRRNIVSG